MLLILLMLQVELYVKLKDIFKWSLIYKMSNTSKFMIPTCIFLLVAIIWPNVAFLSACAVSFVWGFSIAFALMTLIICYLFFSGNALSIRTFYYKEGYKDGYEDKKENREYNDIKMFNIENSSK